MIAFRVFAFENQVWLKAFSKKTWKQMKKLEQLKKKKKIEKRCLLPTMYKWLSLET